ncbi:hypothetical protein EV126DRAFT_173540 [Verticillium dahliae]|nr:hypothetical protein EV126DRAFT_173540 [Verticillium dahliae]
MAGMGAEPWRSLGLLGAPNGLVVDAGSRVFVRGLLMFRPGPNPKPRDGIVWKLPCRWVIALSGVENRLRRDGLAGPICVPVRGPWDASLGLVLLSCAYIKQRMYGHTPLPRRGHAFLLHTCSTGVSVRPATCQSQTVVRQSLATSFSPSWSVAERRSTYRGKRREVMCTCRRPPSWAQPQGARCHPGTVLVCMWGGATTSG